MWLLASRGICLAILIAIVRANTEKVIFKAPAASRLPDTKPGVDYLAIPSLEHSDVPLSTSLPVAFPQELFPAGRSHWYLLRGLVPGRRYELRICWSATQPTSFRLNTHTISDVFDSPLLIRDVAKAAPTPDSRSSYDGKTAEDKHKLDATESVLYLQVQAAADYYSPNKTLMLQPPNVDVDIILDPYIANLFPKSLVPTATYLSVIAFFAWTVSKRIWMLLRPQPPPKPHTD